jgi:hypothetical protein
MRQVSGLIVGLSAVLGAGIVVPSFVNAQEVTPSAVSTPAPPRERMALPSWTPPVVQTGAATLVRRYPAQEAGQGAAIDARYVYAIVNSAIGKYDRQSGTRVGQWLGARDGLIRHLNSCFAQAKQLWCANSNFPELPMASSIEVFNSDTMTHVSSHSLGLQDEGSLTFFEPYKDGWLAGFAHYDAVGGLPFKNSSYASIVTYDAQWRRTGGWMLPKSVQEQMSPHAASGGALGPDGLLYVLGHSKPELYVLARPARGPVLLHIATFSIEAEGQAFAWDKSNPRRIAAISRPNREIRVFDIPNVVLNHPDALPF